MEVREQASKAIGFAKMLRKVIKISLEGEEFMILMAKILHRNPQNIKHRKFFKFKKFLAL